MGCSQVLSSLFSRGEPAAASANDGKRDGPQHIKPPSKSQHPVLHARDKTQGIPHGGAALLGDLWEQAAQSLEARDKESLGCIMAKEPEAETADDHIRAIESTVKELQAKEGEVAAWRSSANRVLLAVENFKSVGDAVVQFDRSGYATLAWSAMTFGMRIAFNERDVREFVFESTDLVTTFMARYRSYESLYRGEHADDEFDRSIVRVYKAILIYVIAMEEYLRQSSWTRVVKAAVPIEKRSVYAKKEDILKADEAVRTWIPIITMKHNYELQVSNQNHHVHPPNLALQCLQALAFAEMDVRPKSITRATKGTCEWLLRHDTYTRWNASHKSLLWIKGKPGSGKSTLLRYALDNAMAVPSRRDTTLVLSFFFHGRGTELQRSPTGLFRSLLHNILRWAPESDLGIVEHFQQQCHRFGSFGEAWQWDPNDLQRLFEEALPKILERHSILLFIDALDECGEENAVKLVVDFKSLLKGLSQSTTSQIRVCFGCRHYPVVDIDYGLEIRPESENKRDIAVYVESRFTGEYKLEEGDNILEAIKQGANGVFLWARLATDRALHCLRQRYKAQEILDNIQKIPPDLENLYLELITTVEDGKLSLKLIEWICFSQWPLTLDELRWVMALDADADTDSHQPLTWYKESKNYIADNNAMEQRLKVLSAGLAETVPSAKDTKVVVQFIHQSVKDFFIGKGLLFLHCKAGFRKPDQSRFRSVVVGDAHRRLAKECLHFLAMKEIIKVPYLQGHELYRFHRYLKPKLPFIGYAVSSWPWHLRQSEDARGSEDNPLEYLVGVSQDVIRSYVRISGFSDHDEHYYMHTDGNGMQGMTTMAHIAASNNLTATIQAALQMGKDVNNTLHARDEIGRTPFTCSILKGHKDVVKLLLDSGRFDCDAEYKDGTLLVAAIENGHTEIAKLLLDPSKVDCNFKGNLKSPFWAAVGSGNADIVELLLNIDDIDYSAGSLGETPLSLASQRGYTEVVKLLLVTGKFDCNVADKFGKTALHKAAIHGHREVVELLLDAGQFEHNAEDKNGRTALDQAVIHGHAEIFKLLLDVGKFDHNAKDKYGRTALYRAAIQGDTEIVQLLLDAGSDDITIFRREGFKNMGLKDDIVQLLSAAGA